MAARLRCVWLPFRSLSVAHVREMQLLQMSVRSSGGTMLRDNLPVFHASREMQGVRRCVNLPRCRQ